MKLVCLLMSLHPPFCSTLFTDNENPKRKVRSEIKSKTIRLKKYVTDLLTQKITERVNFQPKKIRRTPPPPPPPPPPLRALLSSYNQIFREIIEILNKQLFQKEIAFVSRSWKDENDNELPNLSFFASNYDPWEVSLLCFHWWEFSSCLEYSYLFT